MPRNYKADFGADLRKGCMTLVRRTYQANTTEDKTPVLQRMREEVEAVNLSLRLSVDLKLISINQYGRAIAITDSIGKQATGWQKHSERALAAGLSRQSGQCAMDKLYQHLWARCTVTPTPRPRAGLSDKQAPGSA